MSQSNGAACGSCTVTDKRLPCERRMKPSAPTVVVSVADCVGPLPGPDACTTAATSCVAPKSVPPSCAEAEPEPDGVGSEGATSVPPPHATRPKVATPASRAARTREHDAVRCEVCFMRRSPDARSWAAGRPKGKSPRRIDDPTRAPERMLNPGDDLLFHAVSHAVPSALRGLTAVFGMGTGVSPSLVSPGKVNSFED